MGDRPPTVLILFYGVAVLCEFVAPHDPHSMDTRYIHAPPQVVRFFDSEGRFHFRQLSYSNRQTYTHSS